MGVAQLDYKNSKILIEVNNEVEQTFRAHCCEKEPWTVDFIESIPPGGVFYDIGANVGSYTLIAANRGISTIAVEPSFSSYAQLVRNVMLNDLEEKVIAFPFALADKSKISWFNYQDLRSGGASHVLGGLRKLFFHRQMMPVTTLDHLIKEFELPPPTHIKIDIDGNEIPALKGMVSAISSAQAVLIEMPLESEDKIKEAIESLGMVMNVRFDERHGSKIQNIAYAIFDRPVEVAVFDNKDDGS